MSLPWPGRASRLVECIFCFDALAIVLDCSYFPEIIEKNGSSSSLLPLLPSSPSSFPDCFLARGRLEPSSHASSPPWKPSSSSTTPSASSQRIKSPKSQEYLPSHSLNPNATSNSNGVNTGTSISSLSIRQNLATLSPQAMSTKQSISAKFDSLCADVASFPTAKVYAVRPVDWIRWRVRESKRRNEYEFDVVPMRMAMVVASLALLIRK
mmetsp:Transcript_39926/g.96088  ORF Transcript_39926/g.96088 Transcript_39926/m.96088 type:complete len:210 (-) Transcript_39926:1499-2128(-)